MKVNVNPEPDLVYPENDLVTGGEYAISELSIFVNPELPMRTQRLLIIHAIIENYAPAWHHDKVDDLTALIEDGLDQLV